MTLTKAEISDDLILHYGLSRQDAKNFADDLFEEMRTCLERGEEVKISGFGNFELHDKSERPGRNPKTGKDVPISARRVVTFKGGQKLKALVENFSGELESHGPSTPEDL